MSANPVTTTEVQREAEHPDLAMPVAGDKKPDAVAMPPIIITAHRGWNLINFAELWRFRELLYFLALRDVKVRYKQTFLGAAWAVIQPFMMMVVFSIVHSETQSGREPGAFPYPVFSFAGLLPWTFFATAISSAGNSVVGSERLITKIYFPRLAIPFASVGAALVDFLIAFAVLLGMMAWYRIAPNWNLVMVPVLLVLLTLAAIGVGTLLAALNVAYRDFRYVIPFLTTLWMFATPTVYIDTSNQAVVAAEASAEPIADEGVASGSIRNLLDFNPLTGLISSFRAATLGGSMPWGQLAYSAGVAVVLFLAGCLYFRRVEDSFADVI